MPDDQVTQADLDELLRINAESASAFIRGDIRRYLELIHHSDDYTLMPPNGGDTVRGFEATDEQLDEMERYFRGEQATVEVEQVYASGDLAVLVVVERQHGEVGDHPPQDWSLRVTLVFRRTSSGWEQVHRHADALVHPITFDHLAVLARGDMGPDGGDGDDGD
jgi:ketosteroid isomerase-like protein